MRSVMLFPIEKCGDVEEGVSICQGTLSEMLAEVETLVGYGEADNEGISDYSSSVSWTAGANIILMRLEKIRSKVHFQQVQTMIVSR